MSLWGLLLITFIILQLILQRLGFLYLILPILVSFTLKPSSAINVSSPVSFSFVAEQNF